MIRWESVGELNTIQSEMNRALQHPFDSPARAGQVYATMQCWIPPMDLIETGGDYVLRADLPGLSQAEVNIELADNVLTLSGERKAVHEDREEGYYRVERAFGAFSRSLTLPEGIHPDSVQAHFDRGMLEIRIPKPEQRKPRKSASARASATPRSRAGEPPPSNRADVREPVARPVTPTNLPSPTLP